MLKKLIICAVEAAVFAGPSLAQSVPQKLSPGSGSMLVDGYVPTAPEWTAASAGKQDVLRPGSIADSTLTYSCVTINAKPLCLGGSQTLAPGDLGLGSAANYSVGTSGATVPLLNGTNNWAGTNTFSANPTITNCVGVLSGNGSLPATCSTSGFSVVDYGADPTGLTSSIPAFNAAKAANPNGGKIRIPCGTYMLGGYVNGVLQSGFVNDVPGLTFEGDNQQCVRLAMANTSGIPWTISAAYANLYNATFWPTVRNTGPQTEVTGTAAFWVGLRDVEVIYGGCISVVNGANQNWWQRVQCRSMLSALGLDYEGTAAAQALALTIDDSVFDQPWPVAEPNGLFTTWAASTAMVAGAVIDKNGVLWQAKTSCTTGSTGPSGLPAGTTPESQFTNTIADGTCQWYWVSADGLILLYNNSYGRSLFVHDSAFLDGAYGYVSADTVNDGGSFPEFNRFSNFTTDSNLYAGMSLGAGADFRFVNGFNSSTAYGAGVGVGGSFKGDLTYAGGIIFNNGGDGLDISVAAKNIHIDGNTIAANGLLAGTWNNLNVSAAVIGGSITNNSTGASAQNNTSIARGIWMSAVASDYLTITGNNCGPSGATTCFLNQSTGTHNYVPTGSNN